MNNDDKLALLRYLIFIRGKLQHLSIELLLQGQDTQAGSLGAAGNRRQSGLCAGQRHPAIVAHLGYRAFSP